MNLDYIIFVISAVVAIFGGIMMIAQRNPVASVLYLILSLLAQSVLYVQLAALFVAGLLIIIYAGAILVLFLFVIMLLNLRGSEDLGSPSRPMNRVTKYLLVVLFAVQMVFVIRSVYMAGPGGGLLTPQPDQFGDARATALKLFTDYLYPLELTGVLLLAALVAAVVIARKDRSDELPETEAEREPVKSQEAGR